MNSIQLLLDSSSLINYYNLLPSHRHVFPVSAAVGWLKQPMSLRQYIAKGNSRELLSSVMNLDVTAVTGNAALRPLLKIFDCKGRTQCRRLPALCGVWGRVVFKPQALPTQLKIFDCNKYKCIICIC